MARQGVGTPIARGTARGRPVPGAAARAGAVTASLFAVADSLVLIVFPWFLMDAFHSILDLTLKAAYAAAAVAALAAGNDLTAGRRPPSTLGRRRRLVALAGLLAVAGATLAIAPTGTAVDALVTAAAAFGTGALLGPVRALPRRSFPFAPRLPAAGSPTAVDVAAFGAVLAALLLTGAGALAAFGVLALLYLILALVGDLEGDLDQAAARAPAPAAVRPLPPPAERAAAWAHRVLVGDAGIARAPVVSDAAAVAFQVLFALAVYKIVVHMEFTALALGLLVACGAAGELAARAVGAYARSERDSALGILVGGVWTIGMFAGLAGSAFPPLEFVFWAGAAAGAAFIDQCRARLAEVRRTGAPSALSPMLGAPRLVVMVLAGYLVWWLSTWIAKPHSINLVLTMAGAAVGLALVWDVLPAAVGQAAAAAPHATPVRASRRARSARGGRA
jgi:hypothetical protein